jgi:murein L,D-transpeptidase YcbB/YkuD
MLHSRRSFTIQLATALGLAPAATALASTAARAQEAEAAESVVTAPVTTLATLLRRALPPVSPPRNNKALDATLARLSGFDFDPTLGRLVLVNIASATATAYADGLEVMRSRVIVGSGRNPTPRLSSIVPSVRFNPPWYVPVSIEPEILATGAVGYRRINGTLVLPPGPKNPLGPLRIGLEASDGVYLHGTSSPHLFSRQSRTLSHGCVRVERVVDLAAWILGTTPEQVRRLIATGRTLELVPPDIVRVALVYLTAWPGSDGRLVYHPDPYGLDQPRVVRRVRPPAPRPAVPQPEQVAATTEPTL